MFKSSSVDLKTSGVLNPLLRDYLDKKENVREFYGHFPDKEGFASLIDNKPYPAIDRVELVRILELQANLVENSSENSLNNIRLLKNKNTYTVTTGHQVCLFTGPLYFVYKIFSTINLAEKLKKEFPASDFVPVYWMATEDHDFEEVNHFNVFGKTMKWETGQKGAVGNFDTKELKEMLPQLADIFGGGENGVYLRSLFENAYIKHSNLSAATRYLVNELYGNYGLVVVDGNDKAFKKQFVPYLRKDLFENLQYGLVKESIKKLEDLGYSTQVNPRPINCFYSEPGIRTRIENIAGEFITVGGENKFSKDEMEKLLETHPEKISPNVVLRPLYQQVILPNIAYVGGPGELAYWLEYKKMFDELQVHYPILIPRNFVTVVDRGTNAKIEKLGFKPGDLFKNENEVITEYQQKTDSLFELDTEKQKLKELYEAIAVKTIKSDKSLGGSVNAELQKAINGLDAVISKTNRSLKQRSETGINQVKTARQKLFPGGTWQERYENFSPFYLQNGPAFLELLKEKLDPFVREQFIFVEQEEKSDVQA